MGCPSCVRVTLTKIGPVKSVFHKETAFLGTYSKYSVTAIIKYAHWEHTTITNNSCRDSFFQDFVKIQKD